MANIIETTIDGRPVSGVITERFPNRIAVEITRPHKDLRLLREWTGYHFFDAPDFRGVEGEEVAFELLETLYRAAELLDRDRERLLVRYRELQRAMEDVWMSAPRFDEDTWRRKLAELQERRAVGWTEALRLHAQKQQLRAERDHFLNAQRSRIEQMKNTFFQLHLPQVQDPLLRDQALRRLNAWSENGRSRDSLAH